MIDVLIIGCGPAGSTAALEARRLGLSVLVLDAKPFPRDKTCGGGLTAKIAPFLPPGFQSVVEATIRRVRFEGDADSFEVADDHPLAYMVMRDRFDAFLADAAISAGAEIRFGEQVKRVREEADGVRAETDRDVFYARWGIGADGVEGIVRKTIFPDRIVRRIPALEQERRIIRPIGGPAGDGILIDVLSPRGGYGWIFPKQGRLSIGVAIFRGRGSRLKAGLDRLASRDPAATDAAEERMRGFPIPVYRDDGRSRGSDRWLLTGDAADLVDPLFGEGIYYAVRSGLLAARAVSDAREGAPLSRYDALVDEALGPDLRAAGRLGEILYRFPRWSLRMIRRRPEFIRLYFKVLQGRLSYDEMIQAARVDVLASVKIEAIKRLLFTSEPTTALDP